jgi:F420-dependent oxidoreductase-like protein
MDLRIFTEPQQGATYAELLAVAQRAEALGFEGFFRSDHYLSMGEGEPRPGLTDAWTTLAGIARETSTITLGTLVSSATFRLPGPLAVAVAQVDEMSGGRVELGLGAGWYGSEHAAFGIPFPGLGERFDRLEEQLAVLDGLLHAPAGETFTVAGAHYPVQNAPTLATAHDIPFIIGGSGTKRTPALAAKYANEFNAAFVSVDASAELFDRVRQLAQRALVYSAAQVVCVGRDEAELARRAAAIGREPGELRENGLAGSPAQVVDKLGRFAAAGAGRIYLQLLDVTDLEQLDLIAAEVVPQL